jgi:hypothetical protein
MIFYSDITQKRAQHSETPLQQLPTDADKANSPSPAAATSNLPENPESRHIPLAMLFKWFTPSGDLETNLGASREFFTMLFNFFYLSASMIEPFAPPQEKKTPLGYSLFSTITGGAVALIVAACAAKIQHAIDKLNEKTVEYTPVTMTSASVNRHKSESSKLTYFEWLYKKFMAYFTSSGKLTSWQAIQLAMAKLGQAGDLTGFAVGLLNSPHSSFSKTEQILLNYSIFMGGVIASEAAVRPSRLAMIFNENKARNVPHGESDPNAAADKWTIIFMIAKILQTSIANINFYGGVFDKIMGEEPNTPFGVSSNGIKYGALPIFYVTVSVVLFQYLVSVMNQKHYREHGSEKNNEETLPSSDNTSRVVNQMHTEEHHSSQDNDIEAPYRLVTEDMKEQLFDQEPKISQPNIEEQPPASEEQPPASWLKGIITFLLIGRMLGTATDCSVPLLFALNSMLSSWVYIAVAVAGTSLGARMSTSDWRTNKQNWDAFYKKNSTLIDSVILSVEKNASRFTSNVSTFFSCVCPSTSSIDNKALLANEHRSSTSSLALSDAA